MRIQENYSLKKLNTFEIDAVARFFVEVSSTAQLVEALNFAKQKHLPIFILGGGSNILIGDGGFDGLVMYMQVKGKREKGKSEVEVGAGENWDDVVKLVVERNLQGIECLSGIPGTAGGAVVQNIGAYGQNLGDCILRVEGIEIATGKQKVFAKEECEFVYRGSKFKQNSAGFIVTGFELKLNEGGKPTTVYQDLAKRFEGKLPTLQEVRAAVIAIRASKGYVIIPGYECYKTAGSFFKNPVVSQEKFRDLRLAISDSDQWFWEMGDKVKVAAAKLMQEAGFGKGYREGNVGISPKHSLSIINLGGAKAAEIKAFADKIKHKILEKFGVNLEEEIIYVGNFMR